MDDGPATYRQLDERSARERDELGYDQAVLDLVFHANAERILGL